MTQERPQDRQLDLNARNAAEERRVVVDPSAGLPQDSAIIPNIEAWLKGRTPTERRELLQHPFDDSEASPR